MYQSRQATADVNGRAYMEFIPGIYGQNWEITYSSVSSDSIKTPRVDVFIDNETPTGFVEASLNGKADTSDTKHTIQYGGKLIFVFSGATPGANCVVTLRGTETRR